MVRALLVMRGLDPRIHLFAKTFCEGGWIAGSSPAMTLFLVRLSRPAGERRGADGWRRQAARETIKGCRRQDRDDRAGAGKFLQGFDPGFRQPNAARSSLIGRAPDVNEDTRAASRGAIARIVHEQTAAVERTAAHVVGQHRTDVRAP